MYSPNTPTISVTIYNRGMGRARIITLYAAAHTAKWYMIFADNIDGILNFIGVYVVQN